MHHNANINILFNGIDRQQDHCSLRQTSICLFCSLISDKRIQESLIMATCSSSVCAIWFCHVANANALTLTNCNMKQCFSSNFQGIWEVQFIFWLYSCVIWLFINKVFYQHSHARRSRSMFNAVCYLKLYKYDICASQTATRIFVW